MQQPGYPGHLPLMENSVNDANKGQTTRPDTDIKKVLYTASHVKIVTKPTLGRKEDIANQTTGTRT